MPPSPFFRRRDAGAANVVDGAPFLALLEPDLRQQVRKRLARRRVPAGKALFRPGDAADTLYLIESGRFRLAMSQRASIERVLQFLGPGEVVGEAAFIAETPYVTSAVAIEDATVLSLARADFDRLLGSHDRLLHYLASLIAERQARANARLAAESAPDEARALRGYLTAVYSPRGGAGVTTLALNLAIALAERHPDDVSLLDLDVLFGHAPASLWLEPRGVLAQVTPNTLRGLDRQGLEHYLLKHASSLRIFPAATHPEEGQAITDEHVRAAVIALRRNFGHIVIDLPHPFNEVTLAALDQADRVLLIATPEPTTLHDIGEVRRIFSDVLQLPLERVSYVLNHPSPHATLSVSDFASTTSTPWMEVGHGGEAPAMAALRGESMLSTRPTNPVARGAAELADELTRQASELAAVSGRPV